MGYKEFTSALSNASDADFRDWVGKWLQGWDDAGWVRASDTGQIDPETVAAPTAATWQGFAMYRFDDDAQATAPVFIKVEFGSSRSTGGRPNVRLSIGKGTNGAGVLSVVLFEIILGGEANSDGSATTSTFTHIASSGDGYVAFLAMLEDSTTTGQFTRPFSFVVERSRTVAGDPSGDGLLVIADYSGNNRSLINVTSAMVRYSAINYTTGAVNSGANMSAVPSNIQGTDLGPTTSLAAGGIGPVIPYVAMAPGLAPWQSCAFVVIPAGDEPAGIFSTVLCGAEVTMRPISPSGLHSGWCGAVIPRSGASSPSASCYFAPAIRWEA